MEKNEQVNGYEKYSQYFETIESMCDDEHLAEEKPGLLSLFDRHYVLDSGLHVFIGKYHTWISDLDLSKSTEVLRFLEMAKYNNGHCINLHTDSYGLISYVQRGATLNDGKDSCHLPSVMAVDMEGDSVKNMFFGELSPDMGMLLQEAVEKAENDTTKEEYKSAIILHDTFLDMVKEVNQTHSKEQVAESDYVSQLRQSYAQYVEQEQQELAELENLSPAQLEERLRIIREENIGKKQELKKQELIRQIIQAQQEGKNLDSQIANAKAEIANNR